MDIGQKEAFSRLLATDQAFAYCLITDTQGSTPRKSGAAMIVACEGPVIGTIGGGSSEQIIQQKAREALVSGSSELVNLSLGEDAGMHCGGRMQVFIQVFGKAPTLHIFGAGHVGCALAGMTSGLNLSVRLIDDREKQLQSAFPMQVKKIPEDPLKYAKRLDGTTEDFFVILTRDHETDLEILKTLCKKEFSYLGMIGSTKKSAHAREALRQAGIAETLIDRIEMPIGIDINADSPTEIAVSILASVIKAKNN